MQAGAAERLHDRPDLGRVVRAGRGQGIAVGGERQGSDGSGMSAQDHLQPRQILHVPELECAAVPGDRKRAAVRGVGQRHNTVEASGKINLVAVGADIPKLELPFLAGGAARRKPPIC